MYRVSDELYRSAQPSAHGMRALAAAGIRTIVNLRVIDSDKHKLADTGLGYVRIPMVAWFPREKDVVRFLRVATDPQRTPVLVHCREGADRTGLMAAAYRVVVQGWSKAEAIREMRAGGFGFNPLWQTLVWFVQRMDPARIRRRTGMGSAADTVPAAVERAGR